MAFNALFGSCSRVLAAVALLLCGLVGPAASAAPPTAPPNAHEEIHPRVLDLSGRSVDPLAAGDAKALVFIFVSVDCPVSNSYAPEFRRLEAEFTPKKFGFRLVYPNPDESAEAVKKHLKDFGLPLTALRDPEHQLTRAARVRVTPEAAVYAPGDGFVYHGRIDNRYQDLGLSRPEATSRDLRNVLAAVLSGQPVARKSVPAIGCYIPNLK